MSLRASLTSAALLSPLVLSAHAQTPAAPLPTDWSSARLSSATYVILDPQLVGPNLLGGSDQTSVLAAMRRDAGGALKRRYPGATISRDAASPQAIRVTPVLQTPGALLPWLKLTARLDFALPGGERVSVGQEFSLWSVYQHQSEAANFVYDQLALRLP
ncbi:hypothetical protein [Deinococcus radiopugnans]|uniref:Uncharacterized protein n=1 Tax=Deinococcus radiopugnans ATCC 19172 TaxID=585398 RepID=A0ABR6NX50_9DEIO|nr:hypothetical protein [Deinococcus radiopugnans]MBB6017486.1 hypothetical protein [Deinococcus radiopugnans ATCC 19172]